jgi:hypothetical protein
VTAASASTTLPAVIHIKPSLRDALQVPFHIAVGNSPD